MRGLWRRAVVAGLALALDLAGVEFPGEGRAGGWLTRASDWLTKRLAPGARLGLLGPVALTGSASSAVIGRALEVWGRGLPEGLDLLSEALLLRTVLSVEAVRAAAREVSQALAQDDLAAAKRAWAASPVLATIPCENLSAAQMASLAISQVAIQTNSRAVAPLFYYAIGGLPAAFAYRWLLSNAFKGELGRFGHYLRRIAAGAPAWTTTGLMTVAAELRGADSLGAERVQRGEGGLLKARADTGGIRVLAGALQVSLPDGSDGRVNANGRAATAVDLKRAGGIASLTVGLAGGVLLLAGLSWRLFGPHGRER